MRYAIGTPAVDILKSELAGLHAGLRSHSRRMESKYGTPQTHNRHKRLAKRCEASIPDLEAAIAALERT